MNIEELRHAEHFIIISVQEESFSKDIEMLRSYNLREGSGFEVAKRRRAFSKGSSIHRLDPFVDDEGVLRVGGRIKRATVLEDVKHPVILPRRGHISQLIIRYFHEKVKHQGRGITLNEIRSSGFWIIGASSAVAYYISKCVVCRRLRAAIQRQKMADLPRDRMKTSPPFTYAAVDFFGPWLVKEGRKEVKRYGVLFTCMSSRAVHIETSNTLTTDSFINAYRRFVGRRGPIRQLRCDQGTNFIGARSDLGKALNEMEDDKIRNELLKNQCDWIKFEMNVPYSSHMGGVWERQIRSVRNVLDVLLKNHGQQLDDELLRTLLVECEAIVNSRPLTVQDLNSPDSPEPLSPCNLLTMKSRVLLPPPGVFQRADLYSRKRWRRVQHLANEFWSRWKAEFLLLKQERTKWTKPKENLKEGDVVIIKDATARRNAWPLARVDEAFVDEDGYVRKVRLMVATSQLDNKGRKTENCASYVERPIHKLVLLFRPDE